MKQDLRAYQWGDLIELKYGKSLSNAKKSHGAAPITVFGTNGPTGVAEINPIHLGPSIIVGRKGAYRGIHYAPEPFWVIDTAFFVLPTVPLDLRWCYYALLQVDLNSMDSGSAIPSTRKEDLYSKTVLLPELAVQHAIAEILTALDNKIAENRHLIEIIGQYCLATIVRSLSASATVENLGNICEFHNRRRVPLSKSEREARAGEIPYYGATSRMGYVNEALFDQQMVLVGEDGSVVDEFGHPIVQYIWGPAWVNNHAHVLTGTAVSTEMLRWLLRRCNVESLITGAVQAKLSMGQLKSLRVDLPSGTELDRAEAIISTLSARERAAVAEVECAARVRDELLPLLMSGRITVKDAERAAGDVL